jgi:DNA-binding SARP family transcriptional activator
VLGPLRITAGGREAAGGLRKARELIACLAVHPDGASGDAIGEALWPGARPGEAAARRNLAVAKARTLLRAAAGVPGQLWITRAAGRYRLDPAMVETDLQEFDSALEEARRATGRERLAALRRAAGLYRGELADGAYEWAAPCAENTRRRALDAWTAIAEIAGPGDPEAALGALEAALAHDPYNEHLYHKIMGLQAAAGRRPEAASRTLALLESRLRDLEAAPGERTRQIAAALLGTARPPGTPGRRAGRGRRR